MDAGEHLCYLGGMLVSSSLVQILQTPTPLLIAVREHAALDASIPQVLAELALRGEACGVIVAHNRLHAYAIGDAAVLAGGTRDAALRQIFILRAETCQQLHGALRRLETKPLRFRFLFVLGLLAPFYDEDIRFARAEWLLIDSLRLLRLLSRQGAHLIVTLAPPPSASPREKFLSLVQQRVDLVLQPEIPVLETFNQPKLEM